MFLDRQDHVSRHVPYKKLLKDDDDNPVGILPEAFEMREKLNEKQLSVNWLEYFKSSYEDNVVKMVKSFRLSRRAKGYTVSKSSAFGIGNVGVLEDVCAELGRTKVRVLYDGRKVLDDERKVTANNDSHARIMHLPINDLYIMQALAEDVFVVDLIRNRDIPET